MARDLRTVGFSDYDEVAKLYIQIGQKCHGGLLYRLARAQLLLLRLCKQGWTILAQDRSRLAIVYGICKPPLRSAVSKHAFNWKAIY